MTMKKILIYLLLFTSVVGYSQSTSRIRGKMLAYDTMYLTMPVADTGTRVLVLDSQGRIRYNYSAGGGVVSKIYINAKDYGAVSNGSTDDATAVTNAINAAISQKLPVYIPNNTRINSTIYIHGKQNLQELVIFGSGRNGWNSKPDLVLNTGGVGIRISGCQNITFKDISLGSEPGINNGTLDHPSTVGISYERTPTFDFASWMKLDNVNIHMHTDTTVNSGIGTVGLYNNTGENHNYFNLASWADNPIIIERGNSFAIADSTWSETSKDIAFTGHTQLISSKNHCLTLSGIGGLTIENIYVVKNPYINILTNTEDYPIYVTGWPSFGYYNYGLSVNYIDVEGYAAVAKIDARLHDSKFKQGHIENTLTSAKSSFLITGVNSQIENCVFNVSSYNSSAYSSFEVDNTAVNFVRNAEIYLHQPNQVITSTVKLQGCRVYSDFAPTINVSPSLGSTILTFNSKGVGISDKYISYSYGVPDTSPAQHDGDFTINSKVASGNTFGWISNGTTQFPVGTIGQSWNPWDTLGQVAYLRTVTDSALIGGIPGPAWRLGKLTLVGNQYTYNSGVGNTIPLTLHNGDNTVGNSTSFDMIVGAEQKARISTVRPISGAGSDLVFSTNDNVGIGTLKERMRLKWDGTVTINIIPSSISDTLVVDSAGVIKKRLASSISQWTTNGNNIYYNTGNVGVGMTNPANKIDIYTAGYGEYGLNVVSGNSSAIYASSPSYAVNGNTTYGSAIYGYATTGNGIYGLASGIGGIGVRGSALSGNAGYFKASTAGGGYDKTSAYHALYVKGRTWLDSNTYINALPFGVGTEKMIVWDTTTKELRKYPIPTSQWTTSGSNIYYPTGNVGVGTTSPQSKLHVAGTIRGTDSLKISGKTYLTGLTTETPRDSLLGYKSSTGEVTAMPNVGKILADKEGWYGFTDNTQSTISFNPTDTTFTLTKVSGNIEYIRDGVICYVTATKTATLNGTAGASGTYYIYIDDNVGTLTISKVAWTLKDTKVPVAIIKWNKNAPAGIKYKMEDERHGGGNANGGLWPRGLHYWAHANIGPRFQTGGIATGTVGGTITTQNQLRITEAEIDDEDMSIIIPVKAAPTTQVPTNWFLYHRTSATTWTWDTLAVPYPYNGATAGVSTYIQYDNAGTLTASQNNRWVNSYIAFTNIKGNLNAKDSARIIIIPGRAQFTSLALAQAEDPATFDWTGFNIAECVIRYRVTWNTSGVASSVLGRVTLAAQPVAIAQGISTSAIPVAVAGWAVIGNDVIQNTSGSVGIGDAVTPRYTASIVHAAAGLNIVDPNYNLNRTDSVKAADTSSFKVQIVGGNPTLTMRNLAGVPIIDITSTGKVGIGTTLPLEKVDVVGNVKATCFYTESDYQGLAWNENTDAYTRLGTLTGKALNTTPGDQLMPVQSLMGGVVMNDNGTINYRLLPVDWSFKEDFTASNLTGTDGQVMVEIPKFYYKYENASPWHIFKISKYPLTGFTVHPAFVVNGVENDYTYIGAYEASLYNVTSSIYANGMYQLAHSVGFTASTKTIAKLAGSVATINLTGANGGTGYTTGNVLTITGGTLSATATVTATAGVVTAVTLTTKGYGCTTGVKATTGGTGTGCTINIATLEDQSNPYTELEIGDKLTISGTVSNNGTFTVATKSDQSFTVSETVTDETYALNCVISTKVVTTATTGDKLCSVSGKTPVVNQTRSSFRTMSANRGTNWHQLGYDQVHAIELLATIEYGTFYWQNIADIGPGITNVGNWPAYNNYNPFIKSGNGNLTGNYSGDNAGAATCAGDKAKYSKYRGIENFYGHLFKFVDGININNYRAYISTNYTGWADDTSTGYTDVGADMPSANGYQEHLINSSRVILPSSVGGTGSGSARITDYYTQSSGWRVGLFGGFANTGTYAGGFYWYLALGSGYVYQNCGARLSFK